MSIGDRTFFVVYRGVRVNQVRSGTGAGSNRVHGVRPGDDSKNAAARLKNDRRQKIAGLFFN